ncbi:MAG TPA: autotransporter domain-containing protein, partial [Stellaceae bacterium]|nr:autotransporter domain-containing protein [Stellaceae bacterium]
MAWGIGLLRGRPRRIAVRLATALLLLAAAAGPWPAAARPPDSATWRADPPSNDWDEARDWSTRAVPTATASFLRSTATLVRFSQRHTEIGAIDFKPGASRYEFGVGFDQILDITGTGIVNDSRKTQVFFGQLFSRIDFSGSSTAGTGTAIELEGGALSFSDSSNAGSSRVLMSKSLAGTVTFLDTASAADATIDVVQSNGGFGSLTFLGASTAADAQIRNEEGFCFGGCGGQTFFDNTSTAANAHIVNDTDGETIFSGASTGAEARINNAGGLTFFGAKSTAANAHIVNNTGGETIFGEGIGYGFADTSTAGHATIVNNFFSATLFSSATTAGDANVTTNSGGGVFFADHGSGGNASFVTHAGGLFDMSTLTSGGMTAGSIAGDGAFFLGANKLTVGSNNLSTTVGGVISDCGAGSSCLGSLYLGIHYITSVVGGSLDKVGTGTLRLSGANTYTGGTMVEAGTLALAGDGTLGSRAAATVVSGGTLDLGGTRQVQNGGLTLTGGAVKNGTLASAAGFALEAGTVDARLAGSGGVTKTGAGSVTLSGANAYTGATTIAAGTLALGGGSIAASSGVSLTGAGAAFDISAGGNQTIKDLSGIAGTTVGVGGNTLTFGTGNSTTFGGSFTGSGGLVWNGTGTLSLTGDSSAFTGTTTIDSGIVALGTDSAPNASLGGNVTVAGGTLKGFGTIGGNLANIAGTVQPGGSIGTLTVNGNFTQSAGGTLSIEVGPGGASQLKVGGAATLGGALVLVFDPGVYTLASYKLLTASSIDGTFASVSGNVPGGLAQALTYDPGDLALQLGTPQPVAPTNDTIYTAVSSVAVLNAQQVNGILLDRIGARHAGIADSPVAAAPPPSGIPGAQFAQAGNAAAIGDALAVLPQAAAIEGAWFRGLGGFAAINGSASAPGFTGATGGFLAGYDRAVAADSYLGIAAGYLHSDIDEHAGASGTEGSVRFALYGGSSLGASLLAATAGYAHDWFDSIRPSAAAGTASQSHGGNEATVAGQWSLPLGVAGYAGGAATLTPKAGFQYLHLWEGAFAETGAGGFDLASESRGTDSLQPYIGVAAAQKFIAGEATEVTPELRLGYAHDLFGGRVLTVATASGANFPVTGVAPSRDQVTAGFGLAVEAAPSL